MKNAIVGLGEILWDVFPEGKVLGGAPSNFAYNISQFGYEGYAMSAVGNDPLGEEIVELLDGKELKSVLERTPQPTGTVMVSLNDKGVPEYEITRDVAWDNIPYSDAAARLAANTRAACFGTLAQRSPVSKGTIRSFLRDMPEGSLKIFDINLRQNFYDRELIVESLGAAGMLKINDDEIKIVSHYFDESPCSEEETCRNMLDRFGLHVVILTKGTEGSLVMTREETSFMATPKVEVVDTVGAGDSFTAAFTAGYLAGWPISEAHRLAVEVSAFVCTQHGGMNPLPGKFTAPFR